jgi:hypothetical protein
LRDLGHWRAGFGVQRGGEVSQGVVARPVTEAEVACGAVGGTCCRSGGATRRRSRAHGHAYALGYGRLVPIPPHHTVQVRRFTPTRVGRPKLLTQ